MNKKLNTVHTNTFSKKVFDILNRMRIANLKREDIKYKDFVNFIFGKAVIGYDGEIIWEIYPENSISSFDKSLKNIETKIAKEFKYIALSFNRDNTIYASENTTEKDVRRWLAKMLKKMAIDSIREYAMKNVTVCLNSEKLLENWVKENWTRDCNMILKQFSGSYINLNNEVTVNLDGDITVADVYCLYDILMENKSLQKLYSKDHLDKIYGKQRDPVKTEQEKILDEELNKIKDEFETKLESINTMKRLEYNALETKKSEINDKYDQWIRNEKLIYDMLKNKVIHDLSGAYSK